MSTSTQPIVIKKVKKVVGGHHGGSWKVAYADFVTAMMAFFLLLWLLGSTTPEQRAAIASYFQNPSPVDAAGGSSTSFIDMGGGMEIRRESGGEEAQQQYKEEVTDPDVMQRVREEDRKRLEALKERMEREMESDPALRSFKDQLKLDITDEGLRIQIVDKDGRPMFDSGGAMLKPYFREVFRALARLVNSVPNKISISGHTDATPFLRADGYSNWELSTDRANASRRELVKNGVAEDKIARVVGHGDKILYDQANPYSPINRRISIVVLNHDAEQALLREAGSPQAVVGEGADVRQLQLPRSQPTTLQPPTSGGIVRQPVARGGIQRH